MGARHDRLGDLPVQIALCGLTDEHDVDEEVFLVVEVWLIPGRFDDFKRYRPRQVDLLLQHGAEYVYHGHPFEWVDSPDDSDLPTGIEVLRFPNEAAARAALALMDDADLRAEHAKVFRRVRMYLSRYAAGESLKAAL